MNGVPNTKQPSLTNSFKTRMIGHRPADLTLYIEIFQISFDKNLLFLFLSSPTLPHVQRLTKIALTKTLKHFLPTEFFLLIFDFNGQSCNWFDKLEIWRSDCKTNSRTLNYLFFNIFDILNKIQIN